MVFVTVGTHEQPFDRLVRAVDELVADRILEDEVFIQTGYCTYVPKRCRWQKFIPSSEMREHMAEADVVITHGGPSSFIEAIAVGKVPVVVPRCERFGEHVNDHQVNFVRMVAERLGGIVPVYDTANLATAIEEARRLSAEGADFKSHNAEFCEELRNRIERL
jgi:UDP-N-acetylglucosamine transferase subunit ALG13